MRALLVFSLLCQLLLGSASVALARQTMSFTPGDKPRLAQTSARHRFAVAHRSKRFRGSRSRRGAPEVAAPAAGSGFKMEDGVLTYPAPARFQPKNLKPLKSR